MSSVNSARYKRKEASGKGQKARGKARQDKEQSKIRRMLRYGRARTKTQLVQSRLVYSGCGHALEDEICKKSFRKYCVHYWRMRF